VAPGAAPAGAAIGARRHGGLVRIEGDVLRDDRGPTLVLGATLFRAAWAYRHDRAWLEDQLAFLADHGFSAIRALGVVGDPAGPDYWDGREIDWRWPDYDQVIAGLTDLAYDRYGLRVQWTIFGGADANTPDPRDRERVVDRFAAMARGREAKILAFEIANEHYANGFEGSEGIAELGRLARRLAAATPVLVAASQHTRELCPVYEGGAVDLAIFHFDRAGEGWEPVRQPWRLAAGQIPEARACPALPRVASNNEPIGPGSGVRSETDPRRLVMSAVMTYLAGLPIFVFHSGPGVRDDPAHPEGLRPSRLQELPGAGAIFGAFRALSDYLPPDLATWDRIRSPESLPIAPAGSSAELYVAARGDEFVAALLAPAGRATLTAHATIDVALIDPLTGRTFRTESLEAGMPLVVEREAAVMKGSRRRAGEGD
ncbi:MAG TPA: hypothetical protein VNI83_05275, partial [Vicinamibacterales bacterium]|nr:hypothetical protein [Vicinamibacterales bacterium]